MERPKSEQERWLQYRARAIAKNRGITPHDAELEATKEMVAGQARKKKRKRGRVKKKPKLSTSERGQKKQATNKPRKKMSQKLAARDKLKSGRVQIILLKEEERKERTHQIAQVRMAEAARKRVEEKQAAAMAKLSETAIESEKRQQLGGSPPAIDQTTVGRLPFRILPPGEWTSSDIINYYENFQASDSKIAREIQWQRIRDIQTLKPVKVWVGDDTWTGYVVYEFSDTQNVILECPVAGNAVYVLRGNVWRHLLQLSKEEIRSKHHGSHRRVVHRGDWLARTKRALYQL